jgi:peptidase E
MKKLFLTSTMGMYYKEGDKRFAKKFTNNNKFIENLNINLENQNKIILIAGDPNTYEFNNELINIAKESFKMSGFNFKEFLMMDNRNKVDIDEKIKYSDIIILCGGHVPTQNKYFKEINLAEILNDYSGIIIGQSAGSMNCSDIVYSCPELDGEAIGENFQRFITGLSLTNISIFPHFDDFKNKTIDGLKMIEDVVLVDSKTKPIYALEDGAYIEINNNKTILYGEGYLIYNAKITKLCNTGESVELQD